MARWIMLSLRRTICIRNTTSAKALVYAKFSGLGIDLSAVPTFQITRPPVTGLAETAVVQSNIGDRLFMAGCGSRSSQCQRPVSLHCRDCRTSPGLIAEGASGLARQRQEWRKLKPACSRPSPVLSDPSDQ